MKYLNHWNMLSSPFSPSRHAFFVGGSVEEAVARLSFLIENHRQLGIVVGPNGVGKTSLLRNLRSVTSKAIGFRETGYVAMSGLEAKHLPIRILGAFMQASDADIERQFSLESIWQRIEDLAVSSQVQDQRAVLLIDDLDAVSKDWEQMQRLLHLSNGFTCILAVSEQAYHRLPLDLRDRCELRVDLPAWDLTMTADYFEWALSRYQHDDLFEPQAIVRIQELSTGLPRRMLQLAELALVAGAVQRVNRISASVIDQVASELPLQTWSLSAVS